jgi:chromosome segregation ATPase
LELTDVNGKPRRVPKDDLSEGSTEYHAKFAVPHSSPEGEVTRLELERQLSVSLAVQTEQDQRMAQLTGDLEVNAAETAKHADRLLMQTSLVKQKDVELMDMQAKLDKVLLSRDQQIGQYEKELANVRAKLEAKESELEAVRSRLTDTEKGLTKSKAEADTLRAQTALGSVNTDEGQVTRGLTERVRTIEPEMASMR